MSRMLRLLRSRPNPFSLGARVHGSHGPAPAPAPQTIQIHRVNIRKKWFKPRNFIIAGCVYYFCYTIYEAAVFKRISDWLEEEEQQLTTKEREELEEEALEPFFIPLPFTTKIVDSPPYSGTDPEWQLFIKTNKNRELLRNIQAGLAELVRTTLASTPAVVAKCGQDMKLGRYWLDIQYPSKPPPVFVRKGITIGDDGVSITEEPIDTVTALWIRRALYPSALTISLWSFSGALMKQNAMNLAKLLGYDQNTAPAPPLQQTIEKLQQQIKKPTTKTDSQAPSSFPSAKTQSADGSSTGSTSAVEKRSAETSPEPDSSESSTSSPGSGVIPVDPNAEPDKPKSVKDMYGISQTYEHTSGPWMAFKKTFRQTWRPIRDLPPRGAIHISGMVEVSTPRAMITVDVVAWWDPKEERFDMKTTVFRLRSLRYKTQSPRR